MLKISCSKCFKELDRPGALIFSPPNQHDFCFKTHLCQGCYEELINWLDITPEESNGTKLASQVRARANTFTQTERLELLVRGISIIDENSGPIITGNNNFDKYSRLNISGNFNKVSELELPADIYDKLTKQETHES